MPALPPASSPGQIGVCNQRLIESKKKGVAAAKNRTWGRLITSKTRCLCATAAWGMLVLCPNIMFRSRRGRAVRSRSGWWRTPWGEGSAFFPRSFAGFLIGRPLGRTDERTKLRLKSLLGSSRNHGLVGGVCRPTCSWLEPAGVLLQRPPPRLLSGWVLCCLPTLHSYSSPARFTRPTQRHPPTTLARSTCLNGNVLPAGGGLVVAHQGTVHQPINRPTDPLTNQPWATTGQSASARPILSSARLAWAAS